VRTSSLQFFAHAAVILALTCVEAEGQSTARTPTATTPNQTQTINIHGHVITGSHSGPSILEVRFETDGRQVIGYAYASTSGEFLFQKSGITVVSAVYVVVELEGYAPYRERVINSGPRPGAFDATLSIFLEPEKTFDPDQSGDISFDANQLRTKYPAKAVDEYEKAMKDAAKGNAAKAVEGLQRAVRIDPDFYEALQSLGVQYIALRRFQEAEAALVRARNLSPNSGPPLINLGALYFQQGQLQSDAGHSEEADVLYAKAADILNEAVGRSPLSSTAFSNLGAALYKIGEYERARISLSRALELDDNEDSARLVLINVYVKFGRYEEALNEIGRFLAGNPNAPQRASLESIQAQIQRQMKK
jgi:Flp pilus assembly protein TadD